MAGAKPGGRHGAGSGFTGPVQPGDTVAVMVGDVRQVSIEPPKENLALTRRRIEGEPDGDRPTKKAKQRKLQAPGQFMRRIPMLFFSTMAVALSMAAAEPAIIPLYSGPAPGSENWDWPETEQPSTDGIRRLANVTRPVLMVYLPDKAKANGTGVVVCPGGGFRILAISHEGECVAR